VRYVRLASFNELESEVADYRFGSECSVQELAFLSRSARNVVGLLGSSCDAGALATIAETLAKDAAHVLWLDLDEEEFRKSRDDVLASYVEMAKMTQSLRENWQVAFGTALPNAAATITLNVDSSDAGSIGLAEVWLWQLASAGPAVGEPSAARGLINLEIDVWKKRKIADEWLAGFGDPGSRALSKFRSMPE
jgi:hypothetical protein